jgi:glutathione S-transferase
MAELEIMGVPFSNYVRSVRMLCEEKGVAYKLTPSMPQSPEIKAIHPAGQIPAMRHGDITLFESKAIATYIDRALPGPKLIPEDAVGLARVEQWVSYGNVKVDRWIMREFVVPSVFFDKAKGPDTARIAWTRPSRRPDISSVPPRPMPT